MLNKAVERGVGVIVVSTDFEEVVAICNRAIVFSQGQIVDELSGHSLSTEQLIQTAPAGNMTETRTDAHAIH